MSLYQLVFDFTQISLKKYFLLSLVSDHKIHSLIGDHKIHLCNQLYCILN